MQFSFQRIWFFEMYFVSIVWKKKNCEHKLTEYQIMFKWKKCVENKRDGLKCKGLQILKRKRKIENIHLALHVWYFSCIQC